MWQLLFTFEGRIARGQFWAGHLVLLAGVVVFCVIGTGLAAALAPTSGQQASQAAAIALIVLVIVFIAYVGLGVWSGVCLGIKRFHDRDKPAVWVCVQFVPVIGAFWYSIETGFLRGTTGPNTYGPDPLGRGVSPAQQGPSPIPSPSAAPSVIASAWTGNSAPPRATDGRPGWVLPLMLVLTLPAASILIGGLVTGWQTRQWFETAVHVDGVVTELVPGGATDSGSKTFKAIVTATTPDGAPVRVTDFWAISPSPKIGEAWTLAYQPGHPKDAVIVGFFRQYWLAMLLSLIGGAIVVGWLFLTTVVALVWTRQPKPVAS